jgi:hypothetical protein
MAWALLGFFSTSLAAPLSFDRAVDAQVEWDLMDLPFTIDPSALSKESPLLLQHPQADVGTLLGDDLHRLHSHFQAMLSDRRARDAADVAVERSPQLRGAAGQRSQPLARTPSLDWYSLPFDYAQPDSRPRASGIGEETPTEAAQPGREALANDEDSESWASYFRSLELGKKPLEPVASAGDHGVGVRWDLSTGQRKAAPTERGKPRLAGSTGNHDGTPRWDWSSPGWLPRDGDVRTRGEAQLSRPDFGTPSGKTEKRSDRSSDAASSLRKRPLASPERIIRSKTKPLVWVHLHKAGGTLMCQMAKKNEHVVYPNENCNWKGHDSWKQSGPRYYKKTCADRARMFEAGGFTYEQVEREMDDDELCEEFRYGVMFREPLALMKSIVNFEIWEQRHFDHTFLEVPADLDMWLKSKITMEAVPGNQLTPWSWLDNFQTRVLANAFHVPAGKITEEHLGKARAFLQNHSFTVQILEDLPTSGHELFQKLGWNVPPSAFQHKVNAKPEETRPFTDEEVEYLRGLNKFDYELYKGARGFE